MDTLPFNRETVQNLQPQGGWHPPENEMRKAECQFGARKERRLKLRLGGTAARQRFDGAMRQVRRVGFKERHKARCSATPAHPASNRARDVAPRRQKRPVPPRTVACSRS